MRSFCWHRMGYRTLNSYQSTNQSNNTATNRSNIAINIKSPGNRNVTTKLQKGEHASVMGARIFIRFASPESTALLPQAFAPQSSKALYRFEVLSPPSSTSSMSSGEDGRVRGSSGPGAGSVRPESIGLEDVSELLTPIVATIPSSSVNNLDEIHKARRKGGLTSVTGRVLSCEITRASDGGTFLLILKLYLGLFFFPSSSGTVLE